MGNNPISELMTITMQKIREMVDVNTIVGQPITTDDGVTIIPVSKLSFGFGAGGGEYFDKNQQPGKDSAFGGGSGAGVNISPVAFLVVSEKGVKLLPVAPPETDTVGKIVELVPEVMDRVEGYIQKNKEDK